jgi:hypothetical protein
VLFELALAFPQPRVAPLAPVPHDVLSVQLKRHLLRFPALGLGVLTILGLVP